MDFDDIEIGSPSIIIDEIVNHNIETCKYFDLDELDSINTSEFEFCALHINIHSLLAKLDDLKNIICSLKEKHITIHFILLCETFLKDDNMNLCNIEGYNLVTKNRSDRHRGGVAIYVHESIVFNVKDELTMNIENKFESIVIEAKYKQSRIIVGEIYRVPNSNITQSIKHYCNIVNKLKNSTCKVILGTDQNFDLLKYNIDKNTKELLDSFISTGFLPTITKPTRITHKSATLIDNIYLKGYNYSS